MSGPVRPLRPLVLIGTALASCALAWLLFDTLQRQGADPLPVPWTAAVGLVMLAGLILTAGREVRRWVDGRRPQPLSPLTAARIGVLAAASAWVGALLTGWYAAQALVILPALVGERRDRFILAVLTAVAAAVLSGAGVLAQRWCRRPPDEEEDDEPPTG